jgi:hypothetical protein
MKLKLSPRIIPPIRLLCLFAVLMPSWQSISPQIATIAPKWENFHSDICQFTISLPGRPTQGIPGISTPKDEDGLLIRFYTASTARATYIAACTVFPPTMRPRGLEYLERVRDGMVSSVLDGTLLSDRAFTVLGYPARDLQIRGKYKQSPCAKPSDETPTSVCGTHTFVDVAYSRIILVGQRYYALSVATQTDLVTLDVDKEVNGFFSTLTFQDRQ